MLSSFFNLLPPSPAFFFNLRLPLIKAPLAARLAGAHASVLVGTKGMVVRGEGARAPTSTTVNLPLPGRDYDADVRNRIGRR